MKPEPIWDPAKCNQVFKCRCKSPCLPGAEHPCGKKLDHGGACECEDCESVVLWHSFGMDFYDPNTWIGEDKYFCGKVTKTYLLKVIWAKAKIIHVIAYGEPFGTAVELYVNDFIKKHIPTKRR